MKHALFLTLFLVSACGGQLTDEQRKKMKEGMELNVIRKVSDARLTEAAFVLGRSVAAQLTPSSLLNRAFIDSLEEADHVTIYTLQPTDSLLLSIEKQIVEAYTAGSGQVQLDDNVQRIGRDSLLYTSPVMETLSDGSIRFRYALGIRFPKKVIVLSIKE
jgi:hypothetical protein